LRACPGRAAGPEDGRGRQLEISPYHPALARQRAKQQDPEKQKLLRQRETIVEPVFGVIKQARGFRRWTVRGLENVRTQWALICTAFNLRKMYKAWEAGQLAWA